MQQGCRITGNRKGRNRLCFMLISSAIDPRHTHNCWESSLCGLGFLDLPTVVILEDTVQKASQPPLLAEKKLSPSPSSEVFGYRDLVFGMCRQISCRCSEPLSWDRELEAPDRVLVAQLKHSMYSFSW